METEGLPAGGLKTPGASGAEAPAAAEAEEVEEAAGAEAPAAAEAEEVEAPAAAEAEEVEAPAEAEAAEVEEVERVVMEAHSYGVKRQPDWFAMSVPWTVRLRYCGRQVTLPFYKAGLRAPSVAEVLRFALEDTASYVLADTYEQWVKVEGLVPWPKAETRQMHRHVKRLAGKLRGFLRNEYEEALNAPMDWVRGHTFKCSTEEEEARDLALWDWA